MNEIKLKSILPCVVMLQGALRNRSPDEILNVVSTMLAENNFLLLNENERNIAYRYCKRHKLSELLAHYRKIENGE